jgi:Holliday junction resolvasome RuvABC ATP-dependent DNA helicase subunit
MKKLWIRPVHDKKTDRLMSIAVCTTKHEVLVDEQVLEHFALTITGGEVRDSYPDHTLVWGPPIVALT